MLSLPNPQWLQGAVIACLVCMQGAAVATISLTEQTFSEVALRYDENAEQRVRAWKTLLQSNKHAPIELQLNEINQFFNQIRFVDDIDHWQRPDYWATPIEFLGTNGGDCEDFSIAKYFSLRELGIPAKKLRLMYVTATRPRQAHMVLAYYETPNAIPLVLDNINKRILPASKRRDLLPIYSFNGDGLWLAKEQGRGRQMRSSHNNALWLGVNKKMQQGF